MVIAIVAGVAVFVAVVALLLAVLNPGPNVAAESRIRELRQSSTATNYDNVLRRETTFPLLRRLLSASNWADRAALDLRQAGLSLKVSEYVLLRLVTGVFPALFIVLVFGMAGLTLVFALGAAAVGFMVPGIFVQILKTRRRQTIEKQLAPALALIANSLRSGFAFNQGVELAAKQIDPPIRDELNQYLRDTGLGAPADVALEQMAVRVGSYDLDMMVTTILIQRTTGGNLSEILDTVAETIRERERLQGEIRALTSSQRFTGLVLSLYPVFLCALFVLLAPDLWSVLWKDEIGRIVLGIAGLLQPAGIITIRRILNLEV
jgi:tight adherence protein B